jgi:Tfp pilus assembly protein PilO
MGSKKERVILLAVLGACGAIALVAGVWCYFLGSWISDLRTANVVLQTRYDTANGKLQKLNDLRVQRELAQARLDVAERILPSQEEIENLVDNLSEFAKKSGVQILQTEPVRQTAFRAAKGPVKRFDEAEFNIDLAGDYFQFVAFLNYLENYKRFIKVDDFSISGGRQLGDSDSIKLKFATFTYVDAPAVAPAAKVPAKGVVK